MTRSASPGTYSRLVPYCRLLTALLYVAHSTLLFAAFGNGLLVGRNNVIQLFGAATAFGCAYFGKTVLRSWNPDVPQLAES